MKDAVDRLTPLGLIVLTLLRGGNRHPYEMIRLMRQRRVDRLVSITNGTVYHTVARLERDGFLDQTGIDRDGNRPERTTYALTARGREAVHDWVRRELPRIDRPAEFRVALAEAHNLERCEVVRLLRTRHEKMRAEHAAHVVGRGSAAERGVPEQFLLEIERAQTLLEAELQWTDALIDRIERRAMPWGTDELFPHSEQLPAERETARR